MTSKLYFEDSYIRNFDATVVSCEASGDLFKVVLDKTAFFPEGGGQRPDTGLIDTANVTDVQEIDGVVYHYTDKPLSVGFMCRCSIDWDTRFRRMQNHSGEHIVSGVVHSMYGYDNVGFHMDDDYVTVDFSGELTREQLDEIEDKANEAIYSNYKINCFFPAPSTLDEYDYRSKLELTENVRLVEIENIDLCACCAPHLRTTAEVGIIKILDFMRHRGGVRIVMKSGWDALRDYREKYKSVYTISGLLSAKQGEISSAVERIINENDNIRREFYQFRMSVAENAKSNLSFRDDISYCIVNGFDADMMREVANFGADNSKACFVYSGSDTEGYSYIICSHSLDLRKLGKLHNDTLNGRGGGRDTMIQGKCSADRDCIISFINSLSSGEFTL